MTTSQEKKTYKFKKGELISLDVIYDIQGLGGGDWWQKTGADVPETDLDFGDEIIITRDIEIIIITKSPAPLPGKDNVSPPAAT